MLGTQKAIIADLSQVKDDHASHINATKYNHKKCEDTMIDLKHSHSKNSNQSRNGIFWYVQFGKSVCRVELLDAKAVDQSKVIGRLLSVINFLEK